MKKLQTDQKTSRPAAAGFLKKRPWILAFLFCLLLGCGIVVSVALLGESLSRFFVGDTNVIALVPPKEVHSESQGEENASISKAEAEQTQAGSSDAAGRTGLNRNTEGGTRYTARESDNSHSELQVYDDVQTWDSETHIELFRKNYDKTVKSGDGKEVIAPGTSNYYAFTVKNNGEIPLDYTISLKVESSPGKQDDCPEIPVEWRLLSGDGSAVSGWKEYNKRTEVLKKDALAVRYQDNYTIEWRWLFERGEDMDETDTRLGNMAVDQTLGVSAVIYVQAEQSTGGAKVDGTKVDGDKEKSETPSGFRGTPKTGDTSEVLLYLELLAVSACVLLILIAARKHRKKGEDMQNDQK